jgi:hypothetical protein
MDSKYEEQVDGVDAICPYCGASYQVETENYSEDTREEECEECGKKYWIYQSFSVDTFTKPDCEINGEKHDFELVQTKAGEAYFCKICEKCKLKKD